MAFVSVPNTAELVVYGAMDNQEIATVLNFLFPDPIGTTELTELAGRALAAWIANLLPLLSEDLDLISARATDLSSSSAPTVQVFAAAGTDGAVPTPSIPLNAAQVITHRTIARGRSYRGRTYLCGFPQTQLANPGQLYTSFLANLLPAFGEAMDDIEASGTCTHVVVSRQHDGVPLLTGICTVVDAYTTDPYLDSQRRRLVGRGA